MKSGVYGYARVSSREQNLDRQLDALRLWGVEGARVYADKTSGKDFNRPAYRRLLSKLRAEDTFVVKSIDRLGRNYTEVLDEWRRITKEIGAYVVVLDMPLLDTRSAPDGITGAFIADMVLQLLSYVAELERENILQRQAEGIASARARGVRFGRPRIEKPACWNEIAWAYQAGQLDRMRVLTELGISSSTFYRWLRESATTPLAVPRAPFTSQNLDV